MNCKELIETFIILQKYFNEIALDEWANNDEYGIVLPFEISGEDLLKLKELGWLPGCDAEVDSDDVETWLEGNNLVEIFNKYNMIYRYL